MKINFLEIAQIELDDAIGYYNYEAPGLGDAFLTEVLNALDLHQTLIEALPPANQAIAIPVWGLRPRNRLHRIADKSGSR